jgi:hypothetical protein
MIKYFEGENKMTVTYTTPDGMYRIIAENGAFVPQERDVRTAEVGRIRSEQELQAIRDGGIWTIQDSGWQGFFLGYQQFSNISKGNKSFKSEKAAIAFVNRCSENLQEVA